MTALLGIALSILHVPFWNGDPGDLKAIVNGTESKVVRVQNDSSELLILVVLDLTGDLSLVDPARESLIANLEKLPANAHVAVLRAQDGLRVLVDPTGDRAAVAEAIRGVSISGRAALLDSVETTAQLGDSILAKSNVRLAVLYVTDSTIGNYREDFTNPVVNSSDSRDMSRRFPEGLIKEKIQQLRTRLSQTESPLFIVHLNYQNGQLNEAYQTGLLELATVTGGSAEFCRSVSDIPAEIEKTFAAIASHQSAEIEYKILKKTKQLDVELASEGKSLRYRSRFTTKGK